MVITMKKESGEIEIRAEKALRDVLERIPFLKVKSIAREKDGLDLLINLSLGDKKKALLVEVKNNGQPRMARDAVNQLVRYRNTYQDAYLIFMAPYISPQAADI